MCSKISTSLYNEHNMNNISSSRQRNGESSAVAGAEGTVRANNEFGDWSSSESTSDKPRVSSDNETTTSTAAAASATMSSEYRSLMPRREISNSSDSPGYSFPSIRCRSSRRSCEEFSVQLWRRFRGQWYRGRNDAAEEKGVRGSDSDSEEARRSDLFGVGRFWDNLQFGARASAGGDDNKQGQV